PREEEEERLGSVSASLAPWRFLSFLILLNPDDRLQQGREHPLAIDAGQGQGDLGLDDAVTDAQVMPGPAVLQGQVFLAAGQGVQRGGELDRPALADVAADEVLQQV